MSNIKLVTESSCDLNEQLINKYDVEVIKQNIAIGDNHYLDGELGVSEFYDMMSQMKELPKTSCPSPEVFKEYYKSCKEDNIIVFTLAAKLSGSYSVATLGEQLLEEDHSITKNIAVIDTESGSVGQALLICLAGEMIKEGKSFDEIVDTLNNKKRDLVFYGALGTLENAIKGGRVNPIAGKIINALNFKAIIKIGDSEVKPVDKARGDNNALKKVVEKILDETNDTTNKKLFIAHADCEEKAL